MQEGLRKLLGNLSSIVLASLLGIVIWIAATLQTDPFTSQQFPGVIISWENQQEDTILVEDVAERVTVKARGPRSVLAELDSSDFQAKMDLSVVEPGTPTLVPVEVTTGNKAVRIESWEPTEQLVHLETVRTITMPVTVEVEGQVATGYQGSSPVTEPDEVAIHGPEPLLAQVASVIGSVDVQGAREDVVEEVRVTPLDANGELVPGLQWTPDQVETQVRVRRRLGYKPDVQVVPDLRGEPARGYRLGSVEVEPSTVTLAGVPSVLEELPGFVETWPISVTSATEDLFELSPLTVPNSVVVVGVDYVTVTVEVLPIESSRAMTATVEMQGVRPGWIASPSPGVVDVIVEGPDTILAEMTSDDLRVILDLFGHGLGVHRVEPVVLAPDSVVVVSIIPETLEVVVEPVPTPTPTLTPTLTITPAMTVQP